MIKINKEIQSSTILNNHNLRKKEKARQKIAIRLILIDNNFLLKPNKATEYSSVLGSKDSLFSRLSFFICYKLMDELR